MKHKKFVKQLMSRGVERNAAERMAATYRRAGIPYASALELLEGKFYAPKSWELPARKYMGKWRVSCET